MAVLLLVATGLLVGCGHVVESRAGDLRYAMREAGVVGRFTVASHAPVQVTRGRVICHGPVTATDGRLLEADATLNFDEPVGARIQVQYATDGSIHRVGLSPVTEDLSTICICICICICLAGAVAGAVAAGAALGHAAPVLADRLETRGWERRLTVGAMALGLSLAACSVVLIAISPVARMVSPD
ncbi:hypothetical protein [Kitasatospora sp. NPDC001175]|uniref:hypothetical protein n=1 Tax=Kitasatospora sp. NPDC001175 TaxID=3157103 RepID=UPI003D079410